MGTNNESDPAGLELVYIDEQVEGYRRRRCGKGFIYLDVNGKRISKRPLIERLRTLSIPPAWTEVWIAPLEQAHIQATGRDSRGRKQYIYHPRWEELRSSAKFDLIHRFAQCLPAIRERVDQDLRQPALSRETVMAFAVRLLDRTLLRIGNPEYARHNDSYGLTTLRDYHVSVTGSMLRLVFRGKGGKPQHKQITDRRLARLAQRYQELPGQTLLQYCRDDGQLETAASEDVNQYLKHLSGHEFTAKHFRTWGGSVAAAVELYRLGPPASKREGQRKISQAMKKTAALLGNTPTICRKYYVHPDIIEAFQDQRLFEVFATCGKTEHSYRSPEEAALLELLGAQ